MCQIKACLRRLSHSSIVFWLSTVQREKKCCSNYLSIISDRIFLITYMNCCWHSFDNWFAAGPALNRNSLQIFIPSVFFFSYLLIVYFDWKWHVFPTWLLPYKLEPIIFEFPYSQTLKSIKSIYWNQNIKRTELVSIFRWLFSIVVYVSAHSPFSYESTCANEVNDVTFLFLYFE